MFREIVIMSKKSLDFSKKTLKDERIMLVGGAGFIGHHLALALREKEADVIVVDNLQINNIVQILGSRDYSHHQRNIYLKFIYDRFELMRANGVNFINIDARNLNSLNDAYSSFKPSKIVHLAAISSAGVANKNPTLAYDIQINSLRNVIDICKNNLGVTNQIVFMSSSTIYGDFNGKSVSEEIRPQPKGVYANGKYIGERMVREAKTLFDIEYTIIRPSALYGIRCISGRVSQKFVENALSGKPLILEGGGGGMLDFTHIDDLIEGIVRSMVYKAGLSKTFNITYGNARYISDLAKIIKERIPDVKIENAPIAQDKPIRGTLEIDRAKKFLNFYPSKSLELGYGSYCDWYINQWKARIF